MEYKIDKSLWHTCKICNKTIKELTSMYGVTGVYYSTVFKRHLEEDHGIDENVYFEQFSQRPICACGICGQKCNIAKSKRSFFYWKEYTCGRHRGTLEWSKKAKIDRKGEGNPMYGKKPWNKGISYSIIKSRGKTLTEEHKKKLSKSAKKRKVHGHTGKKHSKETKEKFRKITLERIKNGEFKQTKTKPHIKMSRILDELNVLYEEEKILSCWCFDFFLTEYNIYIEVDGDYFHSNPKIYPNGPKTKTQKINWYRDIKKNNFCKENNIILVRFWECDILNNKDDIICKLKELLA